MDWNAFASTLGLIFVAELGDKTQLAVIAQTCKYRRPWSVFWGASLALTLVTLIGALGGQLLGRFIPARFLRLIAAGAFIVMGLLIIRELLKKKQEHECSSPETDCAPLKGWDWKAFTTTCGLLFFAELGDKTQLAVLSLAGRSNAPWAVFVGGALALILVTALGVIGGNRIGKLIPEPILLTVSGLAFMVMGILIGVGVL